MRIRAPHIGIDTVGTKRQRPSLDRREEREQRLWRGRRLIETGTDDSVHQGTRLIMRVAAEEEEERRDRGETGWVSPLWFELAEQLIVDLWNKGCTCLKELLQRFAEKVPVQELKAVIQKALNGESFATA